MTTIKAAAIQLEAKSGDVAGNLESVESLCKQALEKGARLIALPEFFTTRITFDDSVYDSVLPVENEAVDLLLGFAKHYGCCIGGSMLVADQGEVYNRYYFVESNGKIHTHDKDLPTMWENAFYAPGNDDGYFDTEIGGVGAAVCWELIRSQTVKRLAGNVDIMMTGSHWWTLPNNWGALFERVGASTAQYNRYLCENAPIELSRLLGVPVLHANHCGAFETLSTCLPGTTLGLKFKSKFVGNTQIIDAKGQVIASRRADDGEGIVVADVDLSLNSPSQSLGDQFWIPSLPLLLKFSWVQDRSWAKSYYHRKGRELGLQAAEKNRNKAAL